MGPNVDKLAAMDAALDLQEGDLLLLVAICHMRRGDPRSLVNAVLEGAAMAYCGEEPCAAS